MVSGAPFYPIFYNAASHWNEEACDLCAGFFFSCWTQTLYHHCVHAAFVLIAYSRRTLKKLCCG